MRIFMAAVSLGIRLWLTTLGFVLVAYVLAAAVLLPGAKSEDLKLFLLFGALLTGAGSLVAFVLVCPLLLLLRKVDHESDSAVLGLASFLTLVITAVPALALCFSIVKDPEGDLWILAFPAVPVLCSWLAVLRCRRHILRFARMPDGKPASSGQQP